MKSKKKNIDERFNCIVSLPASGVPELLEVLGDWAHLSIFRVILAYLMCRHVVTQPSCGRTQIVCFVLTLTHYGDIWRQLLRITLFVCGTWILCSR